MKVGITGGTGFLGGYTAQAIFENKWTPIIFSRSEINNSKYKTIQTDYTIRDLVNKTSELDAIVHLAASRKPTNDISAYHSSEVIAQNVFEACKSNKIKNIVFASSISVYGDGELLPWSETQIPTAPSMYGISKFSIEMIANLYSEKNDLKIKNLRFAHLFGFNEKNNYMINLFMRKAFKQKKLTLDTSSQAKREFLYVKDAALAIIKALNHEKAGTFNVGNANSILTNEDIAILINKNFENGDKLVIKRPEILDNSSSSFMSHLKSSKIIGFTPQYTFEDALKEIFISMKGLDDVPEFY